MRFSFRKTPQPVPPLTKAQLEREHPQIADALRAEGASLERERVRGVYLAASYVTLHPLVERLMFDGRTPPEAAALAAVAMVQAEAVILAEAARSGSATQPKRH